MATQTLCSKLVPEELTVEIDFLSRLKVGETLVTAASAIEAFSGTDALANLMLSGLPVISGTIVSQTVIGGEAGVIYRLAISVRSSANDVLINEAKLAVLSSPAATPAE